jgi:hypothetical protein
MLDQTKVSRSLDRKTLFLWLEITDIFFLVTFCSILNLMFGTTGFKNYLVYLPTLILTLTLILTKRGKPERFLVHFLKFQFQPKHLTCFRSDEIEASRSFTFPPASKRKDLA